MGAIQSSINSLLGTAATAAVAGKHFADKRGAEVGKVEARMTRAALEGAGKFSQEDINAYMASAAAGMKPTPEFKPQHDAMKAFVADNVLKSETYGKMLQSTRIRNRILGLDQSELTAAVSPMDSEGGVK